MNISLVEVSIKCDEKEGLNYAFCIEVPKSVCEEELINLFGYKSSVDFMH